MAWAQAGDEAWVPGGGTGAWSAPGSARSRVDSPAPGPGRNTNPGRGPTGAHGLPDNVQFILPEGMNMEDLPDVVMQQVQAMIANINRGEQVPGIAQAPRGMFGAGGQNRHAIGVDVTVGMVGQGPAGGRTHRVQPPALPPPGAPAQSQGAADDGFAPAGLMPPRVGFIANVSALATADACVEYPAPVESPASVTPLANEELHYANGRESVLARIAELMKQDRLKSERAAKAKTELIQAEERELSSRTCNVCCNEMVDADDLANCAWCDQGACEDCRGECRGCHNSFCTLCSTVDYSIAEDRLFCVSCLPNANSIGSGAPPASPPVRGQRAGGQRRRTASPRGATGAAAPSSAASGAAGSGGAASLETQAAELASSLAASLQQAASGNGAINGQFLAALPSELRSMFPQQPQADGAAPPPPPRRSMSGSVPAAGDAGPEATAGASSSAPVAAAGDAGDEASSLDPDFLAALPEDIRQELLEQEARERRATAAAAGRPPRHPDTGPANAPGGEEEAGGDNAEGAARNATGPAEVARGRDQILHALRERLGLGAMPANKRRPVSGAANPAEDPLIAANEAVMALLATGQGGFGGDPYRGDAEPACLISPAALECVAGLVESVPGLDRVVLRQLAVQACAHPATRRLFVAAVVATAGVEDTDGAKPLARRRALDLLVWLLQSVPHVLLDMFLLPDGLFELLASKLAGVVGAPSFSPRPRWA